MGIAPSAGRCSGSKHLRLLGGSRVGETPRLSRASPLSRSTPSPHTSSSAPARSAPVCLPAPGSRIGVTSRRAGSVQSSTAASAPAPEPRDRGVRSPRTRKRGLLRTVQPRGGGGNRGHVTAPRVPKGGASREAAALPAGARARPRPHVFLRPRGMWVTEPSGLTCPRPPPPPQRPLCNAASRARPANRRPRAAERKHSAHVARAARPCEGGAAPAPPGRAAALQGTVRATAGRPGGRREPSPRRIRCAQQPTPRPWGHPWPPPSEVPQRAPSAPSAGPTRRSLALTRIHLHGALGKGAEAARFPQRGQLRLLSAAPPRAGGSGGRGAPSWAERPGRRPESGLHTETATVAAGERRSSRGP